MSVLFGGVGGFFFDGSGKRFFVFVFVFVFVFDIVMHGRIARAVATT